MADFCYHVQVYILIHYTESAVIATYLYISTDCYYTKIGRDGEKKINFITGKKQYKRRIMDRIKKE